MNYCIRSKFEDFGRVGSKKSKNDQHVRKLIFECYGVPSNLSHIVLCINFEYKHSGP